MGKGNRTTDEDVARILALRLDPDGKRRSSREIARLLAADGRKLSHATVGRILREARTERAAVTREVVRDKLEGAVVSDLDVLADLQTGHVRLWRRLLDALEAQSEGEGAGAPDKDDVRSYVRVARELREVTTQRLRIAGAETDADGTDELREAVQSFFAECEGLSEEELEELREKQRYAWESVYGDS